MISGCLRIPIYVIAKLPFWQNLIFNLTFILILESRHTDISLVHLSSVSLLSLFKHSSEILNLRSNHKLPFCQYDQGSQVLFNCISFGRFILSITLFHKNLKHERFIETKNRFSDRPLLQKQHFTIFYPVLRLQTIKINS